jgi:hypothetical protein
VRGLNVSGIVIDCLFGKRKNVSSVEGQRFGGVMLAWFGILWGHAKSTGIRRAFQPLPRYLSCRGK